MRRHCLLSVGKSVCLVHCGDLVLCRLSICPMRTFRRDSLFMSAFVPGRALAEGYVAYFFRRQVLVVSYVVPV